jgi:hypothetical protein
VGPSIFEEGGTDDHLADFAGLGGFDLDDGGAPFLHGHELAQLAAGGGDLMVGEAHGDVHERLVALCERPRGDAGEDRAVSGHEDGDRHHGDAVGKVGGLGRNGDLAEIIGNEHGEGELADFRLHAYTVHRHSFLLAVQGGDSNVRARGSRRGERES